MPESAVVLLSGGADSATAMACARRDGFRLHALTIDYGQRHSAELEMARRQAESFGAEHRVLRVDLRPLCVSALTSDIRVPTGRDEAAMADGIPVTYVPARNTIFLSLALGWAESLGTGDIYIGVNALDFSGYPDCRPEYIAAFETMARLATKRGVEGKAVSIHTPLIGLGKADIFRLGHSLGVDFALTHSCYAPAPDGRPCGACDSCKIRRKGFLQAGIPDPLAYAE